MEKAVFPLYYFPPVSMVASMIRCNEVHFSSNESFEKQTLRNRTYITTANGPLALIIPLEKARKRMPMRDVKISYAENWQRVHIHAIVSAYRKSPWFYLFEEELTAILLDKENFLVDLNYRLLEFSFKILQLEKKPKFVAFSSEVADKKDVEIFSEELPQYPQVFEEKHGFLHGMGLLDVLCNEIYYFQHLY